MKDSCKILGKKQISKIFLSKYRKGRVKAFCKKCWQYQQLGLLDAGSRNGRKISSDMCHTHLQQSLEAPIQIQLFFESFASEGFTWSIGFTFTAGLNEEAAGEKDEGEENGDEGVLGPGDLMGRR